ncbi:MAG TPA: sugar phosphate isomerase/epimerase [Steroidobacteraceae bacterium]|nr:sugar phosphate isomerase/epimerase [Steroidobacteraceae bacterium]
MPVSAGGAIRSFIQLRGRISVTGRLSRRAFVGLSAAAILSDAFARDAARTRYSAHLGFQAYTVRAQLQEAPEETLRRVAAIGYREVELYQPESASILAPLAAAHGVRVIGSHVPDLFPTPRAWPDWRSAGESTIPPGLDLQEILLIARTHGLTLLGYASGAPVEAYVDEESYRAYARLLDRIGARCRAAGVSFVYHNHRREFAAIGGRTYFDVLAAATDPDHVGFEVDVCWAAQGGRDPAALISQLRGRVPAIHLKDRTAAIAPSALAELAQNDERRIVAEVGRGTLDIRGILLAARGAGVRHVFVEQDFSAGDPVDSLAASYAYVRGLGL